MQYYHRKLKLPANTVEAQCCVEAEVVQVDIPLLLSKTLLRRPGRVLEMKNNSTFIFKQPVPLEFTISGHYCVDIRDKDTEKSQTEDDILKVTEIMSIDENFKVLLKLHKLFVGAYTDRLQRLTQSSGNEDNKYVNILEQIIHGFDICQWYSNTKPKSAVGLYVEL